MGEGKKMTAGVKSVRLEREIAENIPEEVNFSSHVNRVLEEDQKKIVWIPNTHIEEYAGISCNTLWNRMQHVQYLRTNRGALRFTLYPVGQEEISMNKRVHAYARGDFNKAHDGFVYFNVEFPVNLYLFLASREWNDVERFYLSYLAFRYWNSNEAEKGIMESQLEKKTLKTVIKTSSNEDFKELTRLQKEFHKKKGERARAPFNIAYFRLLTKMGVDPIMFSFVRYILDPIFHPFPLLNHIQRETDILDLRLNTAYMRDLYEDTDDWQSLIVKGTNETDGLHRAESQKTPLTHWKFHYQVHNESGIRVK
jgi:hypothetical protein